MAISSQYITDDQFTELLGVLNLVKSGDEAQELIDRATGDMEGDLCERYIVPLIADNDGAYSTAPQFGRNKILNTIKSKIRQIIGSDANRNLVIESTEKFIDVHKIEYRDHIKTLLDPKKIFGFKMVHQAEGAVAPVQTVGLARADNDFTIEVDPWATF